MKKILIVNQHYMTGGIKKSLSDLLPILQERYDVRVMFLCGDTIEFEKMFPGVLIKSPFLLATFLSPIEEIKKLSYPHIRLIIKIIFTLLAKLFGNENIIDFLIAMMKKIGSYDCAISYSHDNWGNKKMFFGGANRIVEKKVDAKQKIAWIHGEPRTNGLNAVRLNKTYKRFDTIVTVSEACKKQFDEISQGKFECIAISNLHSVDKIKILANEQIKERKNDIFQIVTVGRMSGMAKRPDKINEVARLLKKHGVKFNWWVVGEGSERLCCIEKCLKYGLEKEITYLGEKKNPYPYMKNADLFVLVSDSESSSIVLNESLIIGTPLVSTDFEAAKETVIMNKNGLICGKEPDKISAAIEYCYKNRECLKNFKDYISCHSVNNIKQISKIYALIG